MLFELAAQQRLFMIGSSNFGEITVDNLSTCKTWNNEPVVFPFQYIKSLYKLGILKATVSKLHSIFVGVDCKVMCPSKRR